MPQFPFHTSDEHLRDAFRQIGEVSPPPNLWARLETDLPDATELQLAVQLRQAEVTPSANLWESIQATLEQNPLPHNLENLQDLQEIFTPLATFEQNPTDSIWANLEEKLNETAVDFGVFEGLQNLEVTPKDSTWTHIADALTTETDDNAFQQFVALASLETVPTDNSWDSIAARLTEDAEDTQEEERNNGDFDAFRALAGYEAMPPAFSSFKWESDVAETEDEANDLDFTAIFAATAKYEQVPATYMWEKIEAQLDEEDDEIGAFARLRQLDENPSAHVWKTISEELPFHPQLRHYLMNFSRVAAVLLLALGTAVIYNNWSEITNAPQLAGTTNQVKNKAVQEAEAKQARENKAVTKQFAEAKQQGAQAIKTVENSVNTAQKEPENNLSIDNAGNVNSVNNVNSIKGVAQNTGNNKPDVAQKSAPSKQTDRNNTAVRNEAQLVEKNGVAINNTALRPIETPVVQLKELPLQANDRLATAENGLFALPKSDITADLDKAIKAIQAAKAYQTFDPLNLPDVQLGDFSGKLDELAKHDPTSDLTSYKGWFLSSNAQGTLPFTFQKAILTQLSPQGYETNYAGKLGYGGGIGVGYQINRRTGLLLEYNRMVQGQGYSRLSLGNAENLNLITEYNNFPLTVNFQIIPSSGTRATFNIITGVQVGFLDQRSVRMKGEAVISSDYLAKTDLGLVAGAEYNIYLTRKLLLSPGVRLTYTQDTNRFLQPNTTEQLGIGLRLGLTYRFGK